MRFSWNKIFIAGTYHKRLFGFGFLTVCVPILLVAFLSYTLVSGHVQREVNRANLDMINQMQQRIDASLQWISKTIRGLVLDPTLQQYIYQNDRSSYINMMQVTEKLRAVSQSIEYENSVSLLLPAERVRLSTTKGYETVSDMSERYPFMSSMGAASDPKWIVQPEDHTFTYVQPLPLFTTVPLAFLMLDIPSDAFQSILNSVEPQRTGAIILMDEAGTLVASAGSTTDLGSPQAWPDWLAPILDVPVDVGARSGFVSLDQFPAQIVYSKSPSTGWISVLLVPTSAMNALKAEVAYTTLLVCLAAFVTGILLLYFSSHKLYAPIRSLLRQRIVTAENSQDPSQVKIDEWNWIRQEWGQLQDKLGRFHERSSRDETALRDFLFLHLLYGHYENESGDRIRGLIEQYGMNPDNGWDVIVVEVENYELHGRFGKEDRSLILLAVSSVCQDILNQHNVDSHFVNGLETPHVIIVMQTASRAADDQERSVRHQIAETIRLYVHTYLKIPVSIGIGTRYDHPKDIRSSYLEALEALGFRMVAGGGRTVHYRDLKPLSHDFVYPYNHETEIVQSLEKGSRERVQQFFDEFRDAVTGRRYPISQITRSFHMLYVRLVQSAVEMIGNDANPLLKMDVFERMMSARTLDDIERLFSKEIFPRLLPIFEEAIVDRGKALVDAAVQFMREHASQDLTLTAVADHTGVSHSHFSRLFNKHTGQSFAQFVAELKIERSKEILVYTDKTVVEIAEEVGYTERAFRRVFKTLTGQTPAHYRQQQR
ncbi:helix-turn-helix domain-containing protein [Paenibacillus hodogayensis]|uniref:Helix-turn-helix domain-containing protein n=1 Tax=Paenibacillus hodogayensis TaxID=279208 RepID=A0ABV5VY06_9BACL